jgi:hypothetical protein
MEGHHSFAKENVVDGIKALIAVIAGWVSVVSMDQIIATLTLIYMCFLVGEKLWKFGAWVKARKAAKEAPVVPREHG